MWWFNKIDKKHGTGWLGDEPSDKAYKVEEIYSAYDTVVWTEKTPDQWKRFEPIRNQNGSSACVSFTVALMLGAENKLEENKFIVLSPKMIYGRGFEPNGGMFYDKGLSLGSTQGSTLEVFLPSDSLGENSMRDLSDEKESDRIIGKIFRGGAYIYLPKDIDVVASFIQKGKVLAGGTRFNAGGFNSGEVILSSNGTYGHAIALIDFTIWKGEKAIIFQNSWGSGWGFGGLGIITESQFKSGGFILSAYYEDLKNSTSTTEKPKLKILATNLKIGDNNGEVMKLQIILQHLGLFPEVQKCTGYYGGITRQGVKDFQVKYGLSVTGIADADTINKLNF